MKKITLLVLFLTGLCSSAHATEYTFDAINHVQISETVDPLGPSPGDTFIANGYGVLNYPSSFIELTYYYNIAGRIIDATEDGKLIFEHGIEMDGVSNQLDLYIDFFSDADENNADSYTDSYKILTMEVLPLAEEKGYFNLLTGQGEDQITFKLIDSDKERFGIVNNDLLLKISSQIMLADFSNGFPEAFNFGAFDFNCGPLENPFDSCSREHGNAIITMAYEADSDIAEAPIPPAFGLFLTGLGLFSWMAKRNRIA